MCCRVICCDVLIWGFIQKGIKCILFFQVGSLLVSSSSSSLLLVYCQWRCSCQQRFHKKNVVDALNENRLLLGESSLLSLESVSLLLMLLSRCYGCCCGFCSSSGVVYIPIRWIIFLHF